MATVEESQAEVTSAQDAIQAFLDKFNDPNATPDMNEFLEDGVTANPYYLKIFNQDGEEIADFSNLAEGLNDLGGYADEYTDLNTWLDANGYDDTYFDNIDAIGDTGDNIDALAADMGTIDAAEQQAASDYSAGLFGLTSDEFDMTLNSLQDVIDGTTEAQGYSDQDRAIFDRQISRRMAEMSEYATRMVNNIQASTGAMTPALAAADNYTNNISNYAIQAQTQLIEDEMALKQSQIASKQEMWQYMVSQGAMGEQQFLDNMFQAQAMELQGYMASMNAAIQENQQYLNVYQADQQAISNAMEATYNGVMATLGVDQAMFSQAQTYISNMYEQANFDLNGLSAALTIAQGNLDEAKETAATAAATEAADHEKDMDALLFGAGIVALAVGIFVPALIPLAGAMLVQGGSGLF